MNIVIEARSSETRIYLLALAGRHAKYEESIVPFSGFGLKNGVPHINDKIKFIVYKTKTSIVYKEL